MSAAGRVSHAAGRRIALGTRRGRLRPTTTRRRRLVRHRRPLDGTHGRQAESGHDNPEILGENDLKVADVQNLGSPVMRKAHGLLGHLVQEIVGELQDLLLGVGFDPVIGVDRFDQIGDAWADQGCHVRTPSRLGRGRLLGAAPAAAAGTHGGRGQREAGLRVGGFHGLCGGTVRARGGCLSGLGTSSIGSGRRRLASSPLDRLFPSLLFGGQRLLFGRCGSWNFVLRFGLVLLLQLLLLL